MYNVHGKFLGSEKVKCMDCEAFIGLSHGEKIMHYEKFHPKLQVAFGVQNQILHNPRKRLRPNEEEQSDTLSETDSMETEDQPQDILSEPDESVFDVGLWFRTFGYPNWY